MERSRQIRIVAKPRKEVDLKRLARVVIEPVSETGTQIAVRRGEVVGSTDKSYLGSWESIEAFAQAFVEENSLKDRI